MAPYTTTNSFTQAPSPTLIISILVFIMQVVIFTVIIQKHCSCRIFMVVLYSVSVGGQVSTTFLTCLKDPSDDYLVRSKTNKNSKTIFNVDSFIPTSYCRLCDINVNTSSRHCVTCNRCVENFDHHCIWINNCVGSKNYRVFLAMLGFTFAHMAIYLISIALLWSEGNYLPFLA
jgi:palmitoyltransferase